MCGIAGIMTRDGSRPADRVIDAFVAALAHRGPDGVGRYLKDNTAMAQTRLAIIDLDTGDQPLFVDQGEDKAPLALVANGEIYNYIELKQQIAGANYKTQSDCEPPLYLYDHHGIEFAEHLRGMYAIAIHDLEKKRLILSRDPFGIKPLYYGATKDGFVFSSEFQAFLKAGICSGKIRPDARDGLLQLQFTSGSETILEGVYRVLPGETLVIEDAEIIERLQLGALPPRAPRSDRAPSSLEQLDQVLAESVDIHQRSDVPYGMFLSGGIDSSAILAMMARLNPDPVQAYTIGFSGTGAPDEREHARAVANAAGADHHEVNFSEQDFWDLLPEIAAVMDDPAADYAVLPTYKLASEVHKAGLKVVLSGEGGDELFGGYGRYRRAMRPAILGGRPMRQSGALDGMGLLRDETTRWRADYDAPGQQMPLEYSRLQKAQAHDCADWLPNDLLTKLDRCLMAHGVEGRVPFLDAKVADFAFGLPDGLKIKSGKGKWLLRKWLDQHLPTANAFSKKRGFTVPVGEWIANKAALIGPLVARQPGIDEACNVGAVSELFSSLAHTPDKKRSQAAWHLLYYALWHNHHIAGGSVAGGIIENLEANKGVS